jgi:hypothetical protein
MGGARFLRSDTRREYVHTRRRYQTVPTQEHRLRSEEAAYSQAQKKNGKGIRGPEGGTTSATVGTKRMVDRGSSPAHPRVGSCVSVELCRDAGESGETADR